MEKTKAEKRVLIAKDVLANLKADKLRVVTGNYCTFKNQDNWNEVCSFKEGSLKKQLKAMKSKVYCEGCALGGAFQAYVMRYNNYDTYEGTDYFDFKPMAILRKIFTKLQLDMIESAFERHNMTDDIDDGIKECIADSTKFGQNYEFDDERLVAIMENIVQNKGTFKPSKKVV